LPHILRQRSSVYASICLTLPDLAKIHNELRATHPTAGEVPAPPAEQINDEMDTFLTWWEGFHPEQTNSQFFNEERDRLELWAEDMVFAAEKELKDTKALIKAINRQARGRRATSATRQGS
jgi:hypothetical protein